MMCFLRYFLQIALQTARLAAGPRASIDEMTRREWLMVLCAYHGAPEGFDPVRLQKAMFLFARSEDVPRSEQYGFKPYDYGPMSSGIYADLDALVDEGLLDAHSVPGKSWSRYVATEVGREAAAASLQQLANDREKLRAKRLYEIKQSVASLSFNELLEWVYKDHPDMAVNSVFQRLN